MKIPKNHNLALLLIFIVAATATTCQASVFQLPRKLVGGKSTEQSHEISPAPGPGRTEEGRCSSSVKRSCHDRLKNVTACILYSYKAHKDSILLVQNDGEGLLQVNVTVSNTKFNLAEIELPKNQAKKINISANNVVGTSIVLKTGNWNCTILLGSQKQGKLYVQFSAYASQLTPIHGAYMLFFTALIVGGVWVCCKLGKTEQQVDRLTYQELQMAQPETHLANDVETAQGWNQDWGGDDWGEIKEEKSANGLQTGANALPSRTSKTDGWENHWDD